MKQHYTRLSLFTRPKQLTQRFTIENSNFVLAVSFARSMPRAHEKIRHWLSKQIGPARRPCNA